MSRTMLRWMTAGALALAAAGGLEPAEVRAASKANSPKYEGLWPNPGAATQWSISIAPTGEVSGSYRQSSNVWMTPQGSGSGIARVQFTDKGTMTGVLSGAVLHVTGTQTREASSKDAPQYNYSYTYEFSRTATVVPDADGNLQGTSDTGETFTWWRR